MTKIVYGWVVDWNIRFDLPPETEPNVSIDLYFSSREKFKELLGWSLESTKEEMERLLPCKVGADFDDLDYIPENY